MKQLDKLGTPTLVYKYVAFEFNGEEPVRRVTDEPSEAHSLYLCVEFEYEDEKHTIPVFAIPH